MPVEQDPLIASIYNHAVSIDESSDPYNPYALVDGRFYFLVAERDCEYPFIVWEVASDVGPMYTAAADPRARESLRISFKIYSKNYDREGAECLYIRNRLRVAFDNAQIEVTDDEYFITNCTRDAAGGPFIEKDRIIWVWQDYLLTFTKGT